MNIQPKKQSAREITHRREDMAGLFDMNEPSSVAEFLTSCACVDSRGERRLPNEGDDEMFEAAARHLIRLEEALKEARFSDMDASMALEDLRDERRDLRINVGAVKDILTERRRQIEDEKHTPENDDTNYTQRHRDHEMVSAAISYAYSAIGDEERAQIAWPWLHGFKPRDRRDDLIRAAALLIAEVERIDRDDLEPGPDGTNRFVQAINQARNGARKREAA